MTGSSNKPNILLITSDQQHWRTLGTNNPKIKTPNLDRLAKMGTRFDRAYCTNPTCTPCRASLLTGMWPSAHGAYTLGTKLPEDVPTVTNVLRQAGYRTSLIGKAHFEPLKSTDEVDSSESYPRLRDLDYWRTFNETKSPWYGFDHVELGRMHGDEGHAGQHYALWMEQQGFKDWRKYFHVRSDGVRDTPEDGTLAPSNYKGPGYGWREKMHWQIPQEYHYTTWTAVRTNAMIEESVKAKQPFFCWSSYHDPHPPYCVPEPWASLYNPDDMDSELGKFIEGEFEHMPLPHRMTQQPGADWKVFNEDGKGNHGYHTHWVEGKTLSREQLRKSVAIYYGMISFMDAMIGTTLDTLEKLGQLDNTLIVFTTDHGHFLGQHGLVAKGPFHYDDVIRVPMIAGWPGHIPAGKTSDALQSLADYAPTFLEAAGVETPLWMQGRSELDVWTDKPGAKPRDWTIVENHHNGSAVHLRTLITDRYKLTVYRGRSDWGELFDLQNDPDELKNLFYDGASASLRARMYAKLVDADLEREPAPTRRVSGA
ncbi:MAG: sulfatase-like hydrolase/transferase [Phycisphaera sp.]|nr:sulfatase-like hydrolase/transferase [Phycisphaera sp.]